MKKIIFGALLSVMAVISFAQTSTETFAQKHPRRAEVLERANHQESKEAIAKSKGEITAKQEHKLRREDREIKRKERRDAREHNGKITKKEKNQLNKEENKVNNQFKKDLK